MEPIQDNRSNDDQKRALERELDQKLRLLDEARQARDFWRGELYATLRDVADARRTNDDLRRDFTIFALFVGALEIAGFCARFWF